MPDTISILALDPATDVTGLALCQFDCHGLIRAPQLEKVVSSPIPSGLSSLSARLWRIAAHRNAIESYLFNPVSTHIMGEAQIDAVAFEGHTWQGNGDGGVSEALSMAAGAYLTIPGLLCKPVYPINPTTARTVYSRRSLERPEKKRVAIQWARLELRRFDIFLSDSDDAKADALAVAFAAWGQWRKERIKKRAQWPLFGPGSRGGKGKA